jgi:hypothetical protein
MGNAFQEFFKVLLLASLVWVSGMPPADAGRELRCTSVHDDDVSPGLSIRPSSGTVKVPVGTIECHGPVNGHDPTGPGPYYEESRYGTKDPDTCQDGGEGDGVFSFTIPTTGGDQKLTAAFTFTYGGPSAKGGLVAGQFKGDGFRGTADITPVEGNCVTEPVTKIRVNAEFIFSESFFTKP